MMCKYIYIYPDMAPAAHLESPPPRGSRNTEQFLYYYICFSVSMTNSHLETLDLARSLEATEKGKDDQPGHPLYAGIWKENVRLSLFDINISVFWAMLDKFQKQVYFRYIQKDNFSGF